jgi:Cu/Ag efflux protein CusF
MAALRVAAVLALGLLVLNCSRPKPPAAPVQKYAMEGEVLKVNPSDQTATIKHKDIEGWMHAMTMDYPIRSKEELAKLHPGEHIKATVYVQDEEYSVGDIRELPPAQ